MRIEIHSALWRYQSAHDIVSSASDQIASRGANGPILIKFYLDYLNAIQSKYGGRWPEGAWTSGLVKTVQ